jgi:hypothetical protein
LGEFCLVPAISNGAQYVILLDEENPKYAGLAQEKKEHTFCGST